MIVRVEHIRDAKLCMNGARRWFEQHDLSWVDFLRDGLPIEQVEAMDDAFAKRVVAVARQQE